MVYSSSLSLFFFFTIFFFFFYKPHNTGLFYATVTMPLESAKNRMASQKSAGGGNVLYKTTTETIRRVAKTEGIFALWNGFLPYYLRCGGHTTTMFVFVEWMRSYLKARH